MKNRTVSGHFTQTLLHSSCLHAYDGQVPDSASSLSALPSVTARVIAFGSILLGGLAGGLLGYGLVDTQCDGACSVPTGIGMLMCSLLGAGGSAIVAVLVLRVQGEWRQVADPS
jgi:hypothetical protein